MIDRKRPLGFDGVGCGVVWRDKVLYGMVIVLTLCLRKPRVSVENSSTTCPLHQILGLVSLGQKGDE